MVSAAYFRGDGEGLVDMLIAASQIKPCTSSPDLGGMRELVPWQAEDVATSPLLDMPLESASSRRSSMQQPHSGKFPVRQQARSPPAASAQERAAATAASKRSSIRAIPAAPAQVQHPRVASGNGRRLSADRLPAGFACPAVAASPKPETLPMPTGLMSRALVARSRSPSPPKDAFFAVAVLAHVRPVAA